MTHFFVALMTLATAPLSAFAATCPGRESSSLMNPLAFCSITDFLYALLGLIIQIGFPIVVLFIVFIGFRFVQHSAEGNSEKLAEDRKLLLWAFVGALILLGAQGLAIAIEQTVGNLTTGL